MTVQSHGFALLLTITLLGCAPEEADEKTPDNWFYASNIHEAEILYHRDNQVKMITNSGTVVPVEVLDSDGSPLTEFHMQGGCNIGVEFIGQLYSWEAGGNFLSWVDPKSGKISSMSSNGLVGTPCLNRVGTSQIHKWDGKYYFEYNENTIESLSLVEVSIDKDNLSLNKVFDFSDNLEDIKVLDKQWYFQLSHLTSYPDPQTYKLKVTNFDGITHFEDTVSLAFVVDARIPRILIVKGDTFEVLELEEGGWRAHSISTSANLEHLAELILQPNTTTMALGDSQSILGVEFLHIEADTIGLYELVGDDLILKGELEFDVSFEYQIFGREVVFMAQVDGEFVVSSYNVDSKRQFTTTIDPNVGHYTPQFSFTNNSFLYTRKIFHSNGLTVKAYELVEIAHLDLGLQDPNISVIDTFQPPEDYYHDGAPFHNFFRIVK